MSWQNRLRQMVLAGGVLFVGCNNGESLPGPTGGGGAGGGAGGGGGAWPVRAAEELRSALIFRALAHAAVRSPLCGPWSERFQSAAHDEIFHARLCAAIGGRLGADAPRYDARPVHARLAPLGEPT